MPFSGRPISARDLHLIEGSLRREPVVDLDLTEAPLLPTELIPAMVLAVHASRSAVILTDADLETGPRILYANPACERLTGYTPDEILGLTPRAFQGPSTDRAVLDTLRRRLARGLAYEGDIINYRKDGQPYVVSLRITPVRSGGETVAFVAIEDDMTRMWMVRMQREQNIEALLDAHGPPPSASMTGLNYECKGWAADPTGIGGDWSDVIETQDGRVHLVLGDASGHGIVAGIYAVRYRWPLWALLRAGATANEALAELRTLNTQLSAMASVAIVTIESDRRHASVVTAGHPDVVVVDDAGVTRVRSGHATIGVERATVSAEADPVPVMLNPGALVCLFSDGVVERRDESLDVGIDAVADVLRTIDRTGPLVPAVDAVLALAGSSDDHRDDANVIIARV